MTLTRSLALCSLALGLAGPLHTNSATVWDGPVMTFNKTGADPTQPANQDRMTPNVWVTRGSTEGIYNAKTETHFTHFLSPADTAWADGTLASYASLSYTNWDAWAKYKHGGPPSTVGIPAVVHLISEDIYLAVTFKSWGVHGELFAYQRTTPRAAPAPIPLAIAGLGTKVVLTWTNPVFNLQSATSVSGPYTTLTGASSPFTNPMAGPGMYFRLSH